MLRVIRRHRQPLLPADSPEAASQPTSLVAAEDATLDPPSASNDQRLASNHPFPMPRPPEVANRSDFGQFWSDFLPPQSSTLPPAGRGAGDPPPLWSRQPGEPAADYQLFAAWLQLPAPRPFAKSAIALGCSAHRLHRMAARHHWRTRDAAFDHHRADAGSAALDQLLRDEQLDWRERAHRFRLQEWRLHEQMMEAARVAVREFGKHPGRANLAELARLIDLGSVLGRRASGMPVDPADAGPTPPLHPIEVEAALRKVYGSDAEVDARPALSPGEAVAPVRGSDT